MKRTRLVINIWFVLTCSSAFAQDEKTEVAVFAGGYFNSGFQSFKVLNPPQMEVEGTFGFSPAGRSQNTPTTGIPAGIVLVTNPPAIPVPIRAPVFRDGNVYLYSGTLLTYFNQRGTWRPFFTVGAGGITRTAKIAFVQNNAVRFDPSFIISIISPTLVPSTTRTDMALVLGAGFKKYLPHGLGARMDFRDHINKFDQSTVNNMELSLGLFTRF